MIEVIFVKADCFFAAYTECIWIGCVSILGRKSDESIVFYDKRSSYLGVLNNSTNAGALSKKLEENPQKLEDALKVMEILSSVEGTTAVYDESKLKSSLLPFKDWNADDTYYGDIADVFIRNSTCDGDHRVIEVRLAKTWSLYRRRNYVNLL